VRRQDDDVRVIYLGPEVPMNFSHLTFTICSCAALSLALGGCDSSEGQQPPIVIDPTDDAGVQGCSQPFFPDDQPDLSLLQPPRFITDAPNGQAVVDPGDSVDAEITVNGATRQVFVELRDAWRPQVIIYSTEVGTPGNETIPLLLFSQPQNVGRFYMKIVLCGLDCDEREVIFDINPDVNSNYERTSIEDGEVVRVDRTCIDFIPSGTVLIQ
jgi:hypothetical protein